MMQKWVDKNGVEDRQKAIQFAKALSDKYGEAAASYACDMYDAIATSQNAKVPPAVPADTASWEEVGKAINGSLKQSIDGNLISGVVERLVKQAGEDTMLHNAARDRAEFAWIPDGGACAFCIMLASRGWQRASKELQHNHAEHIHANCGCEFAIRFDKDSGVKGYDPDALKKMYDEAAPGKSSYAKMKALRQIISPDEKYRQLIKNANINIAISRNDILINTTKVENSKYGVFISDKSGLKQQGLDNIEKSITKALDIVGANSNDVMPNIYILTSEEIGKDIIAGYNYVKNELYIADVVGNKSDTIIVQNTLGFANPNDPTSSTEHELYHWKDTQDYVKENGEIKTEQDKKNYLNYLQERAKIELEKVGINYSNVRNISRYAEDSYIFGDYDETYTEYRTSLKRK